MTRKTERTMLFIGSIWNLITSLLTMFSYHTWFNREGAQQLESIDIGTLILGTHLIDNISKVILTFGLFVFVGSIINFFIAIKLKDNMIQPKVMIWIASWGIIQLVSMDILGFIIYMIAFVIYFAKNKAVKIAIERTKNSSVNKV